MKTSFLAIVLGLGFALSSAQAADKMGRASFTFWATNSNDMGSIDIWQNSDGSIGGQSGFSQNGMIQLERENGGWEGYADDGFVKASCSDNQCEGQIGSGSYEMTSSEGGSKLKGVLNHVSIRATITSEKIKASGDGSLELRSSDGGNKYSGTASFYTGFGNPPVYGDASLKIEGSMKDLLRNDPVLFTTFLIAPLVRNGIGF